MRGGRGRIARTCVRYEKLIGVGTAFLEVKADASSCGSVLCGVGKQVEQDVGNVFLIDLGTHIRGIDSQTDVTLHLVADLFHKVVTERLRRSVFHLNLAAVSVLQFRQCLDML